MNLRDGASASLDPTDPSNRRIGNQLLAFAKEMFPWHRSMTGSGVQQTLEAIRNRVPIDIHEIPSGTTVLDWQIPDEWIIRDAFVIDSSGRRVIDYQVTNLSVINNSMAVDAEMTWNELSAHLHTLPDHPDWTPYRTAYFQETWGFCLKHSDYEQLSSRPHERYRVVIDSERRQGVMPYGELCLQGDSDDEFLISTHICHPSLANDNLSGITVASELARRYQEYDRLPLSIRFLFLPATIGAIAWLDRNRPTTNQIKAGLVLSNLGDRGRFTYKLSRQDDSLLDRLMKQIRDQSPADWDIRPFVPWGYDERQFCSPGFDLPVGRLTRTPNGEYPEYHTSADDLSLIHAECLSQSLCVLQRIVDTFLHESNGRDPRLCITKACTGDIDSPPIESRFPLSEEPVTSTSNSPLNLRWINTKPWGEPRLGKYDLYHAYGQVNDPLLQQAVLWMLNLSDGRHTVNEIAKRSGLDALLLTDATQRLTNAGLLRQAT